jgi:hypothetical protein
MARFQANETKWFGWNLVARSMEYDEASNLIPPSGGKIPWGSDPEGAASGHDVTDFHASLHWFALQ